MATIKPFKAVYYNEKKVKTKFSEIARLIKIKNISAVIVTNEVGNGIVPIEKMTREFRDLQGRINQYLGKKADEVYLLTCGIPLKIKS